MKGLDYNYHCHTKRCGHATGEDEEYVLKAIELGIKRFGFSDHIILPKGYYQPGIRGDYDRMGDYLSSLHHLQSKYKDQMSIIIGFEAEYYPEMIDYYKSLLKDKIDFLILGQHCYFQNGELTWHFTKDADISKIKVYVDNVLEGLATGLFKYLAHPDLFMHSQYEWNEDLEKESRRLLKGCEELNIPIELNICGMRRRHYDGEHYSYPNIHFFRLAKEYNVKIVLGVDAHDPSHFNKEDVEKAIKFLDNLGLDYDKNYTI